MNWRGHNFHNGWTIIATKESDHWSGHLIILVMAGTGNEPNPYATAQYRPGDTEWYWGNYFRTIEAAVTDYSER